VQTVTVPGSPPATSPGGMLALVSNSGTHPTYTYTGAPELALSVGWQATQNIRLSVGYWALWWLRVARAGEQIDLFIQPNLFPPFNGTLTGLAPPLVSHQSSTLWVQSLTFSVDLSF
jgi:hypothetical protein